MSNDRSYKCINTLPRTNCKKKDKKLTFISDFRLRAMLILCCCCGSGGGCGCCCCCVLSCILEGLAAISGFGGSGGERTPGDLGRTSGGGLSSSSRRKGGGRVEFFLAVNGALMKGLALEEEALAAAELEGVRNLLACGGRPVLLPIT